MGDNDNGRKEKSEDKYFDSFIDASTSCNYYNSNLYI